MSAISHDWAVEGRTLVEALLQTFDQQSHVLRELNESFRGGVPGEELLDRVDKGRVAFEEAKRCHASFIDEVRKALDRKR